MFQSSLLCFESASVSVVSVFAHICMLHVFGGWSTQWRVLKFQVEVKEITTESRVSFCWCVFNVFFMMTHAHTDTLTSLSQPKTYPHCRNIFPVYIYWVLVFYYKNKALLQLYVLAIVPVVTHWVLEILFGGCCHHSNRGCHFIWARHASLP